MEQFQKFLHRYHVRRFQKGEIILVQGEVPTCVYVVKSGIVKTYNLTADGDEKPISFDGKNEMLPIGWAFNKLRYAQYYYEAFTDCDLYCAPRADYVDFLKTNPDATFEKYTDLVEAHINYQMRVNALEQSKASDKVLNTLHFLCLRFGKDIQKDTVRIELPLTQQELANFMGLTRETTGIELKKLQKKGIISYRRQNYVVKTNALDELLDEDYDMGFGKS